MKLYNGIWMNMTVYGLGVYEPMWMYIKVYSGI